ncbi:acyl-CoA thioester hydrolase [Desulfuromusa kysingii]|uniref:Acyl-CoA thioester hydrolase n=1 Tax=Desulfuromusa kysingii TaxID=37625 RepID=A0A1H3X2F7_9BACT|nr:thioesterase family protein [Desulfuromusa kysingii]SDZ93589.1 acyl-CoA thioester hydrolase [Desulfuromusa kysingii]
MKSFTQNIQVRWSDLDPNGHVRHSVYFDYGAQARIAYLQKQGLGIDWMHRKGIGPVLFREEAQFHRELNAGDQLIIDVQLSGLSNDHRKWSMRHRILRGEEICATLNLDGAWLDLKSRRIAPPPNELVERFEDLQQTEDFQIIAAQKKT